MHARTYTHTYNIYIFLQSGRFDGFGKYTWPNNTVYEGYWKAGLRDGHGVEELANGEQYEGGFVRGLKEGLALFRCVSFAYY